MDKNMLSGRVLLKYILFQLPALCVFTLVLFFISQWMDIPPWIILLLVLFWVAKDAAMYPFVWRAYDDKEGNHMRSIIGASGTVTERLSPSGYIIVNGELWRAAAEHENQEIDKGSEIRVKQTKGLTLIVELVDKKD